MKKIKNIGDKTHYTTSPLGPVMTLQGMSTGGH